MNIYTLDRSPSGYGSDKLFTRGDRRNVTLVFWERRNGRNYWLEPDEFERRKTEEQEFHKNRYQEHREEYVTINANYYRTHRHNIVAKNNSYRKSNPLRWVWNGMIHRCTNPNYKNYHRWGGRGIKICDRWLTYENFLEDMQEEYKPGLSLDRIDNNGNYEKANCRWATPREQNQNRRTTVFKDSMMLGLARLDAFGMPHAMIADMYKAKASTVASALRRFRKEPNRFIQAAVTT